MGKYIMIKRMRRLGRKISSIFIVTLILLSALFSDVGNVKASNELSGYSFRVVENEDKTAADIVGDSANINKGVEIIQILDPNGASMDLENVTYHVTQNAVYTFQIFFKSPTGEHTEKIPVSVNTLVNPDTNTDMANGRSASDANLDTNSSLPPEQKPAGNTMTVGELRSAKEANQAPKTIFQIPMYILGREEEGSKGTYQFPGGECRDYRDVNDQTIGDLPYVFERAEITIKDGALSKTYPINYYDEVDGIKYYALKDKSGTSSDFDIAYEVPAGAEVRFIFRLNSKSYLVTENNNLKDQGFKIDYLSGIGLEGGTNYLICRLQAPVKMTLTYPLGYYVTNAPPGKKNVGIEISNKGQILTDQELGLTKSTDPIKRTITYSFMYPAKDLTLTVVGDKDDTPLTYGVNDSTGPAQNNREEGEEWWKKVDDSGVYKEGDPYYGTAITAPFFPYDGAIKVRGGTAKQVMAEGQTAPLTIASGEFSSGQPLNFEYRMMRFNANPVDTFSYYPAPILNFSYYPNGANMETDKPITENFELWSPDWKYDPDKDPPSSAIKKEYTAKNGAKITLTVKMCRVLENRGGKPIEYTANIKIENMTSSFYLRTQSTSTVQGPHYFRDVGNTSLETISDLRDSFFWVAGDEVGGNTGAGMAPTDIKVGRMFLDKEAIYNKNMPRGGIPWESETKPFFRFEITPQWGYTVPRLESYGKDSAPLMTNKTIEIERQELQAANPGVTYQELTPGNYSWFNPSGMKTGSSPFQYAVFMPVTSLTVRHDVWAVDIKSEKITGSITNNDEYVTSGAPNNTIASEDTFDLLKKDTIVFNPYFQAPVKPDQVFMGFKATITAPDNKLLPKNYELVLGKNAENTEWFRPGDSISVSDFFKRDTAMLKAAWDKNGSLTGPEQNRLNLIMYSTKLNVKLTAIYQDKSNIDGQTITAVVKSYLQDVTAADNTQPVYSPNAVDTKTFSVIQGSNVKLTNFKPTYTNPTDNYNYYLNETTTTSSGKVTADQQEIASVKYDKGLRVSYVNADGTPFKGIDDKTVYKTYDGSNVAVIKFPTPDQCPTGKLLDYWTVEELSDTGNWVVKPDIQFKESNPAPTYQFSSGASANNKSIRLKPVWKDIAPESYISIPKTIQLFEKDTNLSPAEDYAGAKVTVTYHSVYNSDKQINVDVLKSFDLPSVTDSGKSVKVSSYDESGNLLSVTGVNQNYARVGTLGAAKKSQDFWFNTPTPFGNGTYRKTFDISGDSGNTGQGILFYISAN